MSSPTGLPIPRNMPIVAQVRLDFVPVPRHALDMKLPYTSRYQLRRCVQTERTNQTLEHTNPGLLQITT